MWTTVDKALIAFFSSATSLELLTKFLPDALNTTEFKAGTLAVIVGFLTWLIPNKDKA